MMKSIVPVFTNYYTMKRYLRDSLKVLLLFGVLTGCQKQAKLSPELPPVTVPSGSLTYVEVPVSVDNVLPDGDDGTPTKSVFNPDGNIAIDLAVNKVALFAFDASTKTVLSDGGAPVYTLSESQRFNMHLPQDHAMDIFVLCNYGDDLPSSFFTNTLMTESMFIASLNYVCGSTESLRGLNSTGLPMAGIMENVTVTNENPSITVVVQKLFSKYNLYLNTSAFESDGYTIASSRVNIRKCNTTVPYFSSGYTQTNGELFADVDLAEAGDLTKLNSGDPMTIYVLENCQGDKGSLSHWYDVASSGLPGLDKCSFIDLGLRAEKDGKVSNFSYYIYLGDDCTTNFDVRRNELHNIRLTLRPSTAVSYGFAFTGAGNWKVLGSGSEYVDVPFETTISNSADITFSLSNANLSSYSVQSFGEKVGTGETNFGYAGVVRLNGALNSTTFNQTTMVTGGNASASSMTDVTVNPYGLKWNSDDIAIEAGQTVQVPFETSFADGDLIFSVASPKLTVTGHTYGSNGTNTTDYPYGGLVTVVAANDAPSGTIVLSGGTSTVLSNIDIIVSADKGFAFTNPSALAVKGGENLVVPYETHLASGDITFTSDNAKLTYVSHTQAANSTHNYEYPYSGTVTFAAAADATAATVNITGGNVSYNDSETVALSPADVITYAYTRLTLTGASSVQAGQSTAAYSGTIYIQRYVNGIEDGEPTTETVTTDLVLSSSDESVATVSGLVVNGIAAGTAKISATYTGTYGSFTTAEADKITITVTAEVITYAYTRLVINGDTSVNVGSYTTNNYTGTLYTQEYRNNVAYGDPATSAVTLNTVTSSNTGIATIIGKKAYGVAAGTTYIGGTYTGTYGSITSADGDRKTLTVNNVTTYALVVTASSTSSDPGSAVTVQAFFRTYVNGSMTSNVNVTNSCTWTAQYGSSVSGSGNSRTFTSYNEGDYTVYASYTYQGTAYNGNATVSFEPQPGILFSPWQFSFDYDEYGYSNRISATADLTLVDASNCSADYFSTSNCSSSDFTYSQSGATITFYWNSANTSGSNRSVSIRLTDSVSGASDYITCTQEYYVAPVEVTVWKVVTTVSPTSIYVGNSATATAYLYYGTSVDDNEPSSWTYHSDVSGSGFIVDSHASASGSTITGTSAGTATITSRYNSKTLWANEPASLTVNEHTSTTVWKVVTTVSPTSIYVGNSATATAYLYYGTSVDDNEPSSWTYHSDVSGSGFIVDSHASASGSTITGTSAGTATITSRYNSKTLWANVSASLTVVIKTTIYKVVTTVSNSDIYFYSSASPLTSTATATLYSSDDGGSSWSYESDVTNSGFTTVSGSSYITKSGNTFTGKSVGTAVILSNYNAKTLSVNQSASINVHDYWEIRVNGTKSSYYKESMYLTASVYKNGSAVSKTVSASVQDGDFSISSSGNNYTLTTTHSCMWYNVSSYTARFSVYTDSYSGTIYTDEAIVFTPLEYHADIYLTYYFVGTNIVQYRAEASDDGLPPSMTLTAKDSAGNTWTIVAPNFTSNAVNNPSGYNYSTPTALYITSLSTYDEFIVVGGYNSGGLEIHWTGSIANTKER